MIQVFLAWLRFFSYTPFRIHQSEEREGGKGRKRKERGGEKRDGKRKEGEGRGGSPNWFSFLISFFTG